MFVSTCGRQRRCPRWPDSEHLAPPSGLKFYFEFRLFKLYHKISIYPSLVYPQVAFRVWSRDSLTTFGDYILNIFFRFSDLCSPWWRFRGGQQWESTSSRSVNVWLVLISMSGGPVAFWVNELRTELKCMHRTAVSPQGAVDGTQLLGLFTLHHVRHRICCLGVLKGGRESFTRRKHFFFYFKLTFKLYFRDS